MNSKAEERKFHNLKCDFDLVVGSISLHKINGKDNGWMEYNSVNLTAVQCMGSLYAWAHLCRFALHDDVEYGFICALYRLIFI